MKELIEKSKRLELELIERLHLHIGNIVEVNTIISANDMQKYGKHLDVLTKHFLENKNLQELCIENKIDIRIFLSLESGRIASWRQPVDIAYEIKEISNAIKLKKILERAVNEVPFENIQSFVADIQNKIIREIEHKEDSKSDINSVINKFYEDQQEYQTKKQNGDELIGISTGYTKLDNIIDGLRPSHLWVIGGYTNVGKTFASLNIVANLIKQNKRVVYYSIEMNSTDILARILGILTNDNGKSIVKGYAKDKDKVKDNLEKIKQSKLSIHSQKSEASEILFSMYEENLRSPVDLFVVDFLQIMTVKNSKSEYETTTTAILSLQQIAKRLNIPIIVLSQISNESAKIEDAVVMGFKGSGAIASASDLAIELKSGEQSKQDWKQKIQEGKPIKIDWSIKKNRHGSVGKIEMALTGNTGIFEDYETSEANELRNI